MRFWPRPLTAQVREQTQNHRWRADGPSDPAS